MLEFVVKLADFGMSQGDSHKVSFYHDKSYRPPEVLDDVQDGVYYDGKKADVWASAHILLELYANRRLSSKAQLAKSDEYAQFVETGQLAWFWAETEIERPSLEFESLLTGMLEENPDRRLSLAQVINSPWLNVPDHEYPHDEEIHDQAQLVIKELQEISIELRNLEPIFVIEVIVRGGATRTSHLGYTMFSFRKLQDRGLKCRQFQPLMTNWNEIIVDGTDSLTLLSIAARVVTHVGDNDFDDAEYTLSDKAMALDATITMDSLEVIECYIEIFDSPSEDEGHEESKMVVQVSQKKGDAWDFAEFMKKYKKALKVYIEQAKPE